MKIGLVGYQNAGKSTLFTWLTGVAADPAAAHAGQSAMAEIPDPRFAPLCAIYKPKKVTRAALEIVDTPGLARDHVGNATRLSAIREAGCLVMVVPLYSGADAKRELTSFQEDLLLADLEIVSRRVEKLRESVKKPRPNREQELAELTALEPLQALLESGRTADQAGLSGEQEKLIRSFMLLTLKPRLVVFNLGDNQAPPDPAALGLSAGEKSLSAPLGLELELARMDEADRAEFEKDLDIRTPRRDEFLRTMMAASGQFVFFTAGEKEVRTWLLAIGGTAVDAADGIHTDLARGFIRAEVMTCDDLIRLGGEREIKAANLMRREPKDYVVKDGDILLIHHN